MQEMTSEIEAMLLPFGARPHWGKIIQRAPPNWRRSIRNCRRFRNLARTYDPAGKFRNEFLDTHVFGQSAE